MLARGDDQETIAVAVIGDTSTGLVLSAEQIIIKLFQKGHGSQYAQDFINQSYERKKIREVPFLYATMPTEPAQNTICHQTISKPMRVIEHTIFNYILLQEKIIKTFRM